LAYRTGVARVRSIIELVCEAAFAVAAVVAVVEVLALVLGKKE
jgi:hypothetical protein